MWTVSLQRFAKATAYCLIVISDEDFHRIRLFGQNCSSVAYSISEQTTFNFADAGIHESTVPIP